MLTMYFYTAAALAVLSIGAFIADSFIFWGLEPW